MGDELESQKLFFVTLFHTIVANFICCLRKNVYLCSTFLKQTNYDETKSTTNCVDGMGNNE